jgi:hypothetical protein
MTMADTPPNDRPNFHVDNVLGSPGTTLLGAGWLLNMVGAQLVNNGIPTTPLGWGGLAVNVAIAAGAALARH